MLTSRTYVGVWIWLVMLGIMGVLAIPFVVHAREARLPVRQMGYLEEAPLWTASQTLQGLLAQNTALNLNLAPDAWISAGKGQKEVLRQGAERLMQRADLDIILVSGSKAASALLKANNGRTPILAFVIEDGAAQKILEEAQAQGVHNFAVRLDTGFARQGIQFFHYHTHFKRLGILVRPQELEGAYSIGSTVVSMGQVLHFEVITYEIPLSESFADCQTGIAGLMAQEIDAFYVGAQQCFDPEKGQIASLLAPLNQASVLTFAREGAEVVRQGAFMGNSSNDFVRRGLLLAQQVNSIFTGTQPDSLPRENTTIPRYSLNLKVLEIIGFDPPFDLLAACDEFFDNIQKQNIASSSTVLAKPVVP